MKLIIVRHGDPDYEKDSLTPQGFKEADLVADRISKLDVKAFYCSPLGRAQDTARPTLEKMGRKAKTLSWLREYEGRIKINGEKKGAWDRLPREWTDNPDFYDYKKWIETDIMQSDNVPRTYKKVCKGIDKLLADHGYRHEGKHYVVESPNHDTVVLFCHFGVEAVILSHIFGCSPMVLWHNFVALPTSVTTLITEEREEGIAVFRTQQFGDVSHLYAAGEEPSFAARFCECFTDDTRH